MKWLISLFVVLLLSTNLFAQTEFMPIGSKLQTQYSVYIGSGKAVFESQKDTVINNSLPLRKILIARIDKFTKVNSSQTIYLYQRGDSIFEYTDYNQKLHFLFRNNYSVGDSFRLQDTIVNVVVTRATIYIDSVIQKDNIKRFAVRMKISPRFGGPETFFWFNMYDKFIPDYQWDLGIISTFGYYDGYVYTPHCYTDSNTSYRSPYYNATICDSLFQTTPTFETKSGIDLKLFPNPADTYFQLETNSKQIVQISIYNISGQIVMEETINLPTNLAIQHLPNGLYFIKIRDNKSNILTEKLIIHH